MKTREEIIKNALPHADLSNLATLEVLLDIRDLLIEANRVEISGVPEKP